MTNDRDLTEDALYRIMYGSIAFQMLYAASELGVFAYLAANPGASPRQVGDAAGLKDYPCDILLTGLRGLRLITDDGSGLRNHPLVERSFVAGEDGRHLPFIHEVVNPGMSAFIDALRASDNVGLRHFPGPGTSLYDRLEQHPDKLRLLHEHLYATMKATMADLVGTGELSGARHILDVAGGTGSNALEIAFHHPEVEVTIVDLPKVVAEAEQKVAAHGFGKRIRVHACDVFNEALPSGADVALLAHMLPIWSPEENQNLLRRVYEALPPGGKVLLYDPMQNDDRDGPDYPVLFPAYYLTLASGHGNFYPRFRYQEWMRAAGFTGIRTYDGLAVTHVLQVGTK